MIMMIIGARATVGTKIGMIGIVETHFREVISPSNPGGIKKPTSSGWFFNFGSRKAGKLAAGISRHRSLAWEPARPGPCRDGKN